MTLLHSRQQLDELTRHYASLDQLRGLLKALDRGDLIDIKTAAGNYAVYLETSLVSAVAFREFLQARINYCVTAIKSLGFEA